MECLKEFGVVFIADAVTEDEINVQRGAVLAARICGGKVSTRIKDIYAAEVAKHISHPDAWVRQAALEALGELGSAGACHTASAISMINEETWRLTEPSEAVEVPLNFHCSIA